MSSDKETLDDIANYMLKSRETLYKVIIRELDYAESMQISPFHTDEIAQCVYTKTALYEMLEIVCSSEHAFDDINAYKKKMTDFACSNKFSSYMFSVAADTAELVLNDYLNAIVFFKLRQK